MMNDAFQTRAEAEGKLQRAKLSSTQLPTYYVGHEPPGGASQPSLGPRGSARSMVGEHPAVELRKRPLHASDGDQLLRGV